MKKIFTLALKTVSSLILFMFSQIRVWALDTTTATTIDKTENIFNQPWIWIAVAAIALIKLLGPFTGQGGNFIVVRKKANNKKAV